eukprot:5815268-Amphidinium_carterae.2
MNCVSSQSSAEALLSEFTMYSLRSGVTVHSSSARLAESLCGLIMFGTDIVSFTPVYVLCVAVCRTMVS